jgi:hypothetical protein
VKISDVLTRPGAAPPNGLLRRDGGRERPTAESTARERPPGNDAREARIGWAGAHRFSIREGHGPMAALRSCSEVLEQRPGAVLLPRRRRLALGVFLVAPNQLAALTAASGYAPRGTTPQASTDSRAAAACTR